MNSSLIVFKPHSIISQQSFKSSDWLSNLLTDEEWDVSHGRYETLNHMKLFDNAEILNLKQLKLRWTMDGLILSNISGVAFPNLKQLFLNGNNLTSIEYITQAYLPKLQNLNLKQNNIVSIRSLSRCKNPNLQQLSLYKNKINDIECLVRWNCPEIKKIWYNGKKQDGNIIGSITWIAKLESNKLKSFILAHQRRIEQDSALHKIVKKNQSKVVWEYVMQDDRWLNWI